MATLNNIIERDDEGTQSITLGGDLEQVYLQRHLDSGATFSEVRSRVIGTLKATRWYRESSAWSKVRDLIEEAESVSDLDGLTEIIEDLRDLAPDEGADVI